MKRYLPIIILSGIIAVSAPFMRPVQSQTLTDRLAAINAARTAPADQDHWVVVISGDENYQGQSYPSGFVVGVSSSSSGAPKFQRGDDLAESLSILKSKGATITVHAWGYLTYTAMK